jgi:hypothetical protein
VVKPAEKFGEFGLEGGILSNWGEVEDVVSLDMFRNAGGSVGDGSQVQAVVSLLPGTEFFYLASRMH